MTLETTEKIRVAIYVRVSTADQEKGFGAETQERDLKEVVERNSYKGWYTNPNWFFIEQGSGIDRDRKELNRMLDMAKKKQFDTVLVWKIDRISRSLSSLLEIFEILSKNNIGFVSYKENIDFNGAIGKLMFQIFGAIAEFERATIQVRTAEGKKSSALSGNFVSGVAPYGYSKLPNKDGKGSKLILIDKEAEIIKQMFHMFLYENKGFTEIADLLNEHGISRPDKSNNGKGKFYQWNNEEIKRRLKDEIYMGKYITNRYVQTSKKPKKFIQRPKEEWIIRPCPAIINQLDFVSAQQKIENGIETEKGGGQEMYLFARKLIDTESKHGFTGYKTNKNTKNYRRKKHGNYKTISISETEIYNFVWSYIKQAITNPEKFIATHKEKQLSSKKLNIIENEIKNSEKAISKYNEYINRVKDSYFKNQITELEMDQFINEGEEKRNIEFSKKEKLEKTLINIGKYDIACRDLETFSNDFKVAIDNFNYLKKRDVIQMLVERIEVHQKDNKRLLKVFFRFDPKVVTASMLEGRTTSSSSVNKKEAFQPPNRSVGGP